MIAKVIYVGDLHGRLQHVIDIDEFCVRNGINVVVQVGDFGLRWPGQQCKLLKYFSKRARQGRPGPTWYTCGGNHEGWHKWDELSAGLDPGEHVELAPNVFYVQRGSTAYIDGKLHLFCGGAESTDRHLRQDGKTWWPQETPSAAEFRRFAYNLADEKPDVVITHDAPLCIELYRYGPSGRVDRNSQPTPRNLQNALDASDHKPTEWYYGHHHLLRIDQVGETRFFGCGLHGEFMWCGKGYSV